jgi:hypothetical protein
LVAEVDALIDLCWRIETLADVGEPLNPAVPPQGKGQAGVGSFRGRRVSQWLPDGLVSSDGTSQMGAVHT